MDEASGKIMVLVGLAIAVVALGSRVLTARLNRKMEQVFSGRQALTPLQFHQKYFHEQGIPPEISTAVREVLQHELAMDMSRLSADDEFTGNLSESPRFS